MGALALDIGIDIAVQVGYVEQLFEVVSGDFGLELERVLGPLTRLGLNRMRLCLIRLVSYLGFRLRHVRHLMPSVLYAVQRLRWDRGCFRGCCLATLDGLGVAASGAGSGSATAASATSALPFALRRDRKSTRLNSSHLVISYAVFCLQIK